MGAGHAGFHWEHLHQGNPRAAEGLMLVAIIAGISGMSKIKS
jgi:hypothetical protein